MADNEKDKVLDDGCLDWDDVIEDDGDEYVILPEGDYVFTVTNCGRGEFAGSQKIPNGCRKIALTLEVKTDDGTTANVKTDLILHRTLEWKLSSFFRCIGQKERGGKVRMDWNSVVGSRGYAHFKPRTYTSKDGQQRQTNDVSKFHDWDDSYFPADNGFTELPANDEDVLPF